MIVIAFLNHLKVYRIPKQTACHRVIAYIRDEAVHTVQSIKSHKSLEDPFMQMYGLREKNCTSTLNGHKMVTLCMIELKLVSEEHNISRKYY